MPTASDFLHEAYHHIEAGNDQYASALLESLVSMEPLHIEAWEAYMQLCPVCEDLDDLCDRVLQVRGLTSAERESLLDYYYFLRQGLKARRESADAPALVTFELVDEFPLALKELHHSASNPASDSNRFKVNFTGWLEKGLTVFYGLLLLVGLQLVADGIQFGYWILLMLAFSVFVNLWNMVLPEKHQPAPPKQRTRTLDRPVTSPSRIPS